jgi:hypothetical protein
VVWFFIIAAVAVRIIHWSYTGRIWEDALITLTPAKNVWEGFGLTHHASEPRVHSFTSPVSVLIPLIGEAFGQGIVALRLCSLVAAAYAIVFAHKICRHMGMGLAAQIFVLSFLSFDHLQIFFGMTGMETQIAVTTLLAAVYFLLSSRWVALGVTLGVCMWCRPDFVIPCAIIGAWLLLTRPVQALKVGAIAIATYAPWLIFATLYYGSPIPNTIVAKSHSGRISPMSGSMDAAVDYAIRSWRDFAPFLEFIAAYTTWNKLPFLAIVLTCLLLGGVGAISGFFRDRRFIVVALIVATFMFYRISSISYSYFMWYIPPFTALFSLCIGAGIQALAKKHDGAAMGLATVLSLAYVLPLPLMFSLDRAVQINIDDGVRKQVGLKLNELMTADDTVSLEPLGYVGFYARNKTVYDFPGLGSKIAVAAVKDSPITNVAGLVSKLQPNYAVLRPKEAAELQERYPDVAARYTQVYHIRAPAEALAQLVAGPFGYIDLGDAEFTIFKRSP